jgi:hypothetical protein
MTTMMMRVSPETRDRVLRVAAEDFGGVSAEEALRRLLDEHWQARCIAAVARDRAADPTAGPGTYARPTSGTVPPHRSPIRGTMWPEPTASERVSAPIEPWQVWWLDLGPPPAASSRRCVRAIVVSSRFHLALTGGALVSVLPLTTRERPGWAHWVRIDVPGKRPAGPSPSRSAPSRVPACPATPRRGS